MTVLRFASGNLHKLDEVREILGPEFVVHGLDGARAWPAVDETGDTFAENASLKASAISCLVPEWVLADDSGLEVDALNGEPGVNSARYAGIHGDTPANNTRLLERLAPLGNGPWPARFRCSLALARAGEIIRIFEGRVEGVIVASARGNGGFGYDPLFVPSGHDLTFAELGSEIKNQLSHRARALAEVTSWFQQLPPLPDA